MTAPHNSSEQSSFGDRLSLAFVAFIRALVRLLLIIFVAALIGVGLYFGIPQLYRQYVVPVEKNTAAIQDLGERLGQQNQALSGRIENLQSRLDSLEVQRDQDRETIASLQSLLDELQGALSEQSDSLDRVDGLVADVQTTLDRLENSLDSTSDNLSAIATRVGSNRFEINALNEALQAADNPINSFRRELQLVKAMELITRSRLSLAQNNIGLAQSDVQLARDLLAGLQTEVLDYQQEALVAIIGRLDLALGNFPDNLALAEDDLEVAWELLVSGLPALPPTEAPAEGVIAVETTPTPEGTPARTGTPAPTPTVTPTPAP